MRKLLIAVGLVGCNRKSSAQIDAPGGDGPSSASYAAYAIVGGLDRLEIAKTGDAMCFAIFLVHPGSATGVALPSGWGVERAAALQPAAACNPAYLGPVSNMFASTGALGTISWQGTAPQMIDSVQVTLSFDNHPAWCPQSEVLATTNLAVH
jgi:hypothetical protein